MDIVYIVSINIIYSTYVYIYIILGIFIYSGLTCYEISTLLINGED